jgi:hypothetical protein
MVAGRSISSALAVVEPARAVARLFIEVRILGWVLVKQVPAGGEGLLVRMGCVCRRPSIDGVTVGCRDSMCGVVPTMEPPSGVRLSTRPLRKPDRPASLLFDGLVLWKTTVLLGYK